MRKLFITLLIAIPLLNTAQELKSDRLNVFIDCSNTWCDMTFIRSEITVVNFSLDRLASDVHVLVTSTSAGGGGQNFQIIFYGQKKYSRSIDTLRFLMSPVATDFERRDMLVKYIKMGLAPAIAKTGALSEVKIDMKSAVEEGNSNKSTVDKWDYWVYRVGIDGNFSADQNYKSGRLSGRLSADRTTDKLKARIYTNGGKEHAVYYSDGEETIVDNYNTEVGHYLIKSLGKKWGGGYEISYGTNTFSNIRSRIFARAAHWSTIFFHILK